MSQVKTKNRNLSTVMRSAAFVRGFNETRTGKPFDYDYTGLKPSEEWSYERGRIFGLTYTGSLKQGNTVVRTAQRAMSDLLREGVAI